MSYFKYPTPDPKLYRALLGAYFSCLKNKSHLKKSAFHLNYEGTVCSLALDIQNRTYSPGMSNIFIVLHPKPREVIAAHLRDRIVHHYIYNYMAPYWEKRFVANSYACRPGKGPLRASLDLRKFIAGHERHRRGTLHYLQLDIQNFFPSIDQKILYDLISSHLTNSHFLWLCKTVLFHQATVKGRFKLTSPPKFWERLPKYKSLFHAPDGKGLPIGNLTSQFFANIYMNELDQFISHKLKGLHIYWQRYVDDILFLGEDVEKLKSIVPLVEEFLANKLKMILNAKKTRLQPLCRGIDHLGYWHKPDHQLVRQRVVENCKIRLSALSILPSEQIDPATACAGLNSYMGYFRKADSYGLRRAMAANIAQSKVMASKIEAAEDATKFVLVNDGTELREREERERQLREEFAREFPASKNEAFRRKRIAFYLRRWHPIADFLEPAGSYF